MADSSTATSRLEALTAWRDSKLQAGVPADELPGEDDIKTIAVRVLSTGLGSADAIPRTMGLREADLCESWQDELFEVLTRSQDAAAEPRPGSTPPGDRTPVSPAVPAGTGDARESREEIAPETAVLRFALLSWDGQMPAAANERITLTAQGDETSQLSWNPSLQEGTIVYRVVSSDSSRPYSPEDGWEVAATFGTEAVDARPFSDAMRFYSVWCYHGTSPEDACASQPELLAELAVVAPVSEVEIQEEEGYVSGRWSVVPGVTNVTILRIPASKIDSTLYDDSLRIYADAQNLSGFFDDQAPRGERIRYRLFATLERSGEELLSPPVDRDLQISADLAPVIDLSYEIAAVAHDGPTILQLGWTPPLAGNVDIYRTAEEPKADSQSGIVQDVQLEAAGLRREDRLAANADLVSDGDGRRRAIIRHAVVPSAWSRAFFTPVTIAGSAVRVGKTVRFTMSASISDLRVVERVDWQLLSFDWPDGAGRVALYFTPSGQPLTSLDDPIEVLTEEDYQRIGGWHLQRRLPRRPCDLHVVPLAHQDGKQVIGKPVQVAYPGIFPIFYRIRSKFSKQTLEVWTEEDAKLPPLVVVHNADRLPLFAEDGPVLQIDIGDGQSHRQVQVQVGAKTWTYVGEFRYPRGSRSGFVRMFACPGPDVPLPIAVIDPPLGSLCRGVTIGSA